MIFCFTNSLRDFFVLRGCVIFFGTERSSDFFCPERLHDLFFFCSKKLHVFLSTS